MKKSAPAIAFGAMMLIAALTPANATDLHSLVPALRDGGHVIVFRHVATDESQKDIYPFKFDDMTAQRQLSEPGRETARALGGALVKLGIPVGEVYTSRLNRAVETGKLFAGKDVVALDDLTDSGAGNPSAMAGPNGGGSPKLGRALRELTNVAPGAGLNTIIVTHKTNVVDAFGKDWRNVREGEASGFKPNGSGPAVLIARIDAKDWISRAGQVQSVTQGSGAGQ